MEKHAIYQSPFGPIVITFTEQVVTGIKRREHNLAEQSEQPHSPMLQKVFTQLDEYFSGKRKSFDFEYKAQGTEFQKKVWKALCDIPYGETRSYKDIAKAVGSEKACRAVGLANNRNPISIVIPCHRVIASNGALTGYAGGLPMKQALLDLEAG